MAKDASWAPVMPKTRNYHRLAISIVLGISIFITVMAASLVSNGATASASASAYTYLVPAQYPTIQAAIDAAYGEGETILVSDGAYNENIDFKAKRITVRSVNGPASTSIQGSGSNKPVVSMTSGEPSVTVLDGFTINNVDTGTYYDMNGIKIAGGAAPTIRNSAITGNNTRGKGAGILIDGGAATIQYTSITGNGTTYEQGAGIYLINGTAPTTIMDSTISGNVVKLEGAGLFVDNSDITLSNVTIENNRSNERAGGGAYIKNDSDVVINGSEISGNASKYSGAGLYFDGGGVDTASLAISDSRFDANLNNTTTTSLGGGLFLANIDTTTAISNTDIINNNCMTAGGGIYATHAPLAISGSTVSNNNVINTDGGGIWLDTSSTITDSDISGNQAAHAPHFGGGIQATGGTTVLTITNTHVDSNVSNQGAGINFLGLQLNFTGGSLNGNVSPGEYSGGGLRSGAEVNMYGTEVIGNSTGKGGAGIHCTGTLNITNSIVANNNGGSAYFASGAGIYGGTVHMMNSTVVGNVTSLGGGMNVAGDSTVVNSICWNNYSYRESDTRNFRGNPTVSYSDTAGGGYVDGGDNISADPLFVNELPYSDSPTTTGDYHLQESSPCKSQATSAGAPADDIDGDSRPQDSFYDMGADEIARVCTGGERPALTLSLTGSAWASYDDYLARMLTVTYRINNVGSTTAYDVQVVGSTATNGVLNLTAMPQSAGGITSGSSAPLSLQYSVPAGVRYFLTRVYATASDGCTIYAYPGPFPG